MDDLISRQAVADWLQKWNGYLDNDMIARMQYRVVDIPSAQRWIPVTEGLPEKSGRYYVTRGLNAAGALWNRVYILNYSDLMGICNHRIWWTGSVGKSDFERIDDVLAWMPLPEPWKGEER